MIKSNPNKTTRELIEMLGFDCRNTSMLQVCGTITLILTRQPMCIWMILLLWTMCSW